MPKYGCDKRCPKVREQLRKARESVREETDDEDSSSDPKVSEAAGPSAVRKKAKNEFTKRSKQSSRYPSGAASPERFVETPQRSHQTLSRESPVRGTDAPREFEEFEKRSYRRSKESERTKEYPLGGDKSPEESRILDVERRNHRRSKESQRSKGYPSGATSPVKSAEPIRRSDPERRINRKSHESERLRREKQQKEELRQKKKFDKSPKSLRNERGDPEEYKSGTSSESGSGEKFRNYVGRRKRGEVGKSKGRIREADDGEIAGPSRKARRRREEEGDDEESENDYPKWSTSAYDHCKADCRGINEGMRLSKNDKRQEEFDEYLLTKNLPYFGDLCNCCYKCFANQLWKDSFVKSTAASFGIFALGVTLCWKLNGWTIPNTS